MALSHVISFGLGSPASVEHLVTLGLEAGADVPLVGGETGYFYAPATGVSSSFVASPAAGTPGLVSGPLATGEPTYIYEPEG